MIGQVVSHYEIIDEIGGGGMGVVYKAKDTRLDRLVALKFLPTEWSREAAARERFTREARAASAIDHPHICTVYDIGETDDGRMYIAMAYYPGQTLTQRILQGALPVETALTIAIQAAEALAAAHESDIVHRDIKPANILLDSRQQVKLVDFGLAKLAGGALVTRTGVAVGTPAYMSPEQAEGLPLDHRTDVWSLGAVLYEMLAGLRAFSGDSDHAVMYSVIHNQPTSLGEVRPELPDEVVAVVEKCLAKNPDRRYPSARALLQDLRRLRGDSSASEGPTKTITSLSGLRRRLPRWAAITAATAAVMVAGVVALQLVGIGRAAPLPAEKTLVVLPFDHSETSPATAALCEGLMDQLTQSLAGMRRFEDDLTVIPAATVRTQRIAEPQAALVAFGATLAIHGTVEPEEGGVLRILLELVDTKADRPVRRRTVPWVVGHGTTLQNRLVTALSEMLEFELDEPTRTAVATGGTADREAQALYMQALGEMEIDSTEGTLRRATDLLRRALEYDPAFTLARVELAEACRRRHALTGEPTWAKAALTYAQQSVDEVDRLPKAHVVLGRVMAEQGMTAEGLTHIGLALELDPLNYAAIRGRALILAAAGDPDGALASFEEAIELRPDDWITLSNAGSFYYDELEFETAATYFRRLVELRPMAAWGWSNLGGALFRADEWDEAREAFGRSLDIGPTYEALSNKGTLEFYSGRYDEAAALYEQALSIFANDWRVWNNLAECVRFGGGDVDRMATAYGKTAELAGEELERRPDDDDLRLSVASALASTGQDQRARQLTDAVIAGGVDDPELMQVVASIEEELGRRDEALEWLGHALAGGYPIVQIESYPAYDDLRSDPEFDALRRRYGGKTTTGPNEL
jgi:serine/threonine-protein kinase